MTARVKIGIGPPVVPIFLVAVLCLINPAHMFAKAELSKITIEGPDLKTPVEITNQKTLASIDVWSGPGTSSTGNIPQSSFILDWSHPVPEPARRLTRYKVSFFAKMPHERLIYVVFYKHDLAIEQGYVCLPGRNDIWYRMNAATILHGLEGNWFRAAPEWDAIAMRLIRSPRCAFVLGSRR